MSSLYDIVKKEDYEKLMSEGVAANGLVKVIVNGMGVPISVEIDPSLLKKKEKENLQKLIIAATTDGIKKSDEQAVKLATEKYNEMLKKLSADLGYDLNVGAADLSGNPGTGGLNGIGGGFTGKGSDNN